MKKAKIMLSAAGLLSLIAGVFAFKAQHKFTGNYACYTRAVASAFTYPNIYTTTAATSAHFTLLCTLEGNSPTGAVRKTVTILP